MEHKLQTATSSLEVYCTISVHKLEDLIVPIINIFLPKFF
jgi:hypothetical protein